MTRVGEVFITKVVPVPVCEVTEVVFPDDEIGPERLALVVTFPAVRLAAVPEIFVPTSTVGVPKLGVTNVGETDNTTLPVPVDVVTPVPPFITAKTSLVFVI